MKMLEVYRKHPDGKWGYFDTVMWPGHTLNETKTALINEGWYKDIQIRYTDPHGRTYASTN